MFTKFRRALALALCSFVFVGCTGAGSGEHARDRDPESLSVVGDDDVVKVSENSAHNAGDATVRVSNFLEDEISVGVEKWDSEDPEALEMDSSTVSVGEVVELLGLQIELVDVRLGDVAEAPGASKSTALLKISDSADVRVRTNLRVLAPSTVGNVKMVFIGAVEDKYELEAWDRAGREAQASGAIGESLTLLGVEVKIISADIAEVDEDIEDGGDPSNLTLEVLSVDENFGTEIEADQTRLITENRSAQVGEYWLDIGEMEEDRFVLFIELPDGDLKNQPDVQQGDVVELFDLELRVNKYLYEDPDADGLTTVEVEIL